MIKLITKFSSFSTHWRLGRLPLNYKVSYEKNLTLSKLNKKRKKATTSPSSANCCIVEAMRVARMISKSNLEKSISLCLDERIVICLKSLPGETIHVIFENYDDTDKH